MKTLQLNKYLLIEPEKPVYLTVSESGLFYADPETDKSEIIEGKFKFICMGDEFEQDQKATKKDACVLGQIFCKLGFDAFVGEIEKEGFYWGENPIPYPNTTVLQDAHYDADEMEKYRSSEWHTFDPSKTRIYEKI